MKRALLVLMVGTSTIWLAPSASAACHAFTVKASSSVNEGDKYSIVVERDSNAGDSSVRVRTINGTAKAPGDFTAYDERVTFTGNVTKTTITIPTKEDATPESTETFQVSVSEGQGCVPNPNYTYGNPATVIIRDDDATPAPTPTPRPTTTTVIRTGIPTSTPSPSGSPTPTPSTTPSASPTETPFVAPSITPSVEEEADGGFPWLPVGIVVGFLAAAGGALALVRMRQSRAI